MKVEKLTEAHDRSPFRCGRDELDEWFHTAAMQTQQRYRSAKTGRGRVLHLDEDTAAAIAARPRADNGRWPLVFTRPDGMPWRPEVISDRWRHQWPALDLPKITLHALRHCHACLLLDQGVPIKVVSERLGHSTIAMTMDVYAHVLPAQDRDASAAIRRALRGESGTGRSAG